MYKYILLILVLMVNAIAGLQAKTKKKRLFKRDSYEYIHVSNSKTSSKIEPHKNYQHNNDVIENSTARVDTLLPKQTATLEEKMPTAIVSPIELAPTQNKVVAMPMANKIKQLIRHTKNNPKPNWQIGPLAKTNFALLPSDTIRLKKEKSERFLDNDSKKIDVAFCLAIISLGALFSSFFFVPMLIVALVLSITAVYFAYPLRRVNTIAFIATLVGLITAIFSAIVSLIAVAVVLYLVFLIFQLFQNFP